MFSVIRTLRISVIFEIGGLNGYSARNFLAAVGNGGTVFTVDVSPVPCLAENHIVVQKNALEVTASDLENKNLELVFFDCHDFNIQMQVFFRLREFGLISDETILALHDTNTHPYKVVDWAYAPSDGYVHQAAERRMVNDFVKMGYHSFSLHTRHSKLSSDLKYRHGLTVLSRFKPLAI